MVRNESTVETVVYVTSLVPSGEARRIDEPSPGNCPFCALAGWGADLVCLLQPWRVMTDSRRTRPYAA
jgi:hypothetical protein